MNKSFLLKVAIVILILAPSYQLAYAQSNENIIYENYAELFTKVQQAIRNVNASDYRSMAKLKEETSKAVKNPMPNIKFKRASSTQISASEMIKERKKSVLLMCKYEKDDKNGDKIQQWASAVVLTENGICVTNYHVLRPLIDPSIKLMTTDSLIFVVSGEGKVYPIVEVLNYNKEADLAIFKIETKDEKTIPMPVGNDLPAGDNVHTLTHPLNYLNSYTRGVVSRNIALSRNSSYGNRTEITADYAKGSSGGAIMDDKGNLVGVVSKTRSIYAVNNPQQSLQMVVKETIPVSTIKLLVNANSNK